MHNGGLFVYLFVLGDLLRRLHVKGKSRVSLETRGRYILTTFASIEVSSLSGAQTSSGASLLAEVSYPRDSPAKSITLFAFISTITHFVKSLCLIVFIRVLPLSYTITSMSGLHPAKLTFSCKLTVVFSCEQLAVSLC